MKKRKKRSALQPAPVRIAETSILSLPEPTSSQSILLGDFEFMGPYADTCELQAEPGVLALLVKTGEEFELLDLVDSVDVKRSARFASFTPCLSGSTLNFAVCYETDNAERQRLVETIEAEFNSVEQSH